MAQAPQYSDTQILLSPSEFELFRKFIYDAAGIDMSEHKRAMMQSRLAVRVRSLGCSSYTQYHKLLQKTDSHEEREWAINLLSTNETYFFREHQHFDWLQNHARQLASRNQPVRVWSAACSTGEEPYTIAIVLAEALGLQAPWFVYATDINTEVTRYAQRAVYPVERVQKTPSYLWQKYFQHGRDEYAGKIRVKPELAKRVTFANLNLLEGSKSRQQDFDVIFLRNVLIYFNEETKKQVVGQLCSSLTRFLRSKK